MNVLSIYGIVGISNFVNRLFVMGCLLIEIYKSCLLNIYYKK